jgi:5'-nucleotidase
MHFLITNDDGVDAPGIAALAEVASNLGQYTVVAPTQGVSSCSHHVTTHRDLEVTQLRANWYSVDGFPADCVRIAMSALALEFDVVLSGINEGGNLGIDLLMSGTASAAREAVIRGLPGIAISQYKARRGDADWTRAALWAKFVLEEALSRPLPANNFWNINLPDPPAQSSGPRGCPEIADCSYDTLPLPVGYRLEGGKWRYTSQYQSRQKTSGKDVERCFSGAITLTAVPCFT